MKTILLIGLGRFGRHIAEELNKMGHEVMAVDENEERVNAVLPIVTNAQIGDSTNAAFLKSLGIANFDVCIVTIGGNFQNSLETASLLKEMGAKFVVARAERDVQEKFLLRNGADEVVYPEKQLAKWAAIRYSSNHLLDYIDLGGDHAIFEVMVPAAWVGKSVGELDIRRRFNINIMAVKQDDKLDISISPSTLLTGRQSLLVLGDYHEEDIYQKIIENAKKANKEEKQKILEYLNWKYPHEEIEGVPTKTSVTKIKEMVNAEQVEEQTKNVKFAVEETKEVRTITQKPKFINNNENAKISNAQKGTLMHLCVQKMNEKEEYTAEKIQELIDGLKKKGIISEAEAENINISKLQGYTKSDLWQELKNAREIHKEKAFYINVKASRMYDISKENDENILVQGIIDLYYIDKDGKLVLVDYKTDYVEAGKESELVEKYKEQLYLYRDALEMALNRKVDRMWIYSLYLNESIVIEK